MRSIQRITGLLCATTLAAACSTFMPGDLLSASVQPHMVPSPGAGASGSQQAQAYSSSASRVSMTAFEMQYEQIWQLVDKYFLYRERMGSWSLWKHRFDGQLRDGQESQQAISSMVGSLKDEYTFYRDVDATAERRNEEQERNVVSSRTLPGAIGYVHLTTFNSRNSVDEMRFALQKLSRARAFVLDLRGNKGGSINNAFRVFALLAGSGKFVRMNGIADGEQEYEELSLTKKAAVSRRNQSSTNGYREANLTGSKPMIVLVDATTKSAAEMLAGALRDNHRAILLGTRTFGKGVIQRVWEFDDGTSIKITAARYLLPGGRNIHGVGLQPDCLVRNKAKEDTQLTNAIALLTIAGRKNAISSARSAN